MATVWFGCGGRSSVCVYVYVLEGREEEAMVIFLDREVGKNKETCTYVVCRCAKA